MKLSIYTFVKNGLRQDYHVVEMLRHHLPLADEIVVHEGMSSDGTYEAIRNIDEKIKIFRSDWNMYKGMDYVIRFKDEARKRCTGDWCILLDCDEFIPEWEFEKLRDLLEEDSADAIRVKLINFYGNYKVFNSSPDRFRWPSEKLIIHRNRDDVEIFADGSSVRILGPHIPISSLPALEIHHFGFVRHGARLREKWRNMRGRLYLAKTPKFLLPSFLFDLLPHQWMDADYLPYLNIYDGPFVQAVRDNPSEFVRDGFDLYKYLIRK